MTDQANEVEAVFLAALDKTTREILFLPLPGDITKSELAGVYLDVAALSVALDGKPLTVRVMPVPGAKAGDLTSFSFDYFANSRVLPAAGAGAARILERGQ